MGAEAVRRRELLRLSGVYGSWRAGVEGDFIARRDGVEEPMHAEGVNPEILVDFFEVGGAELVGVRVVAEEEEVSPIAFYEAEAHGAALKDVTGVEVVFDGFIEDAREELGGSGGIG